MSRVRIICLLIQFCSKTALFFRSQPHEYHNINTFNNNHRVYLFLHLPHPPSLELITI